MSDPPRPAAPLYQAAGVDLDAADEIKRRLKRMVESTFGPSVRGGFGGFGGSIDVSQLPEERPVIVASSDGAGTKVLVAQETGRHETVGEDLVNHCVDDLLAAGARPLFFLDYIATGSLDDEVVVALVGGFARGCRENGIPLLGGETAEMPDLYGPDRYDLAGFIVGVSDKEPTVGPEFVQEGDRILGLASTGLHTNGYTLARRGLEAAAIALDSPTPWGEGSWADAMLEVHRSYLDPVGGLLKDRGLHGVAHVTGGGFAGNLPRALPDGVAAVIDRAAWTVPPIFEAIAEMTGAGGEEMYRVFNMGIGFCLIVDPDAVDRFSRSCRERNVVAYEIGRIEPGEGVEWA